MILRLPSNTQHDELLALNEAFFRLSNIQDFKTLIEWLKLEDTRLSHENKRAQGIQVQWNQGALQALFDILDMSDRDKAHRIVEDLRKQDRKGE